jgi:hypothetical protein|tara:strand:+ start:390 stop:584 length:195 start_codon:yes stop_codon:yes gene_type:complete
MQPLPATPLTNNYDALVLAIRLGITAETEDQARRINEYIYDLASVCTPEDIERAKAEAIKAEAI